MKQGTTALLLLLGVLPSVIDAAAYFFGATEIADDNRQADADLSLRLEAKELRTVNDYCRSLPLLVRQGIVKENRKTAEVCQNILALLRPMFGSTAHKIREHKSVARRLFRRL